MPVADVGKMLEFLFKNAKVADCAFPDRAISGRLSQLSFSSPLPGHSKSWKVRVKCIM